MYAQKENSKENKSRAVANSVVHNKSNGKQPFAFIDKRPKSLQLTSIIQLLGVIEKYIIREVVKEIGEKISEEELTRIVEEKEQEGKFSTEWSPPKKREMIAFLAHDLKVGASAYKDFGLRKPESMKEFGDETSKKDRLETQEFIAFSIGLIKKFTSGYHLPIPNVKIVYEQSELPEEVDRPLEDIMGFFYDNTWVIYINGNKTEKKDDPNVKKSLANTLYHESRHAEQAWGSLLLEARGEKAPRYSKKVPRNIVKEASLRAEENRDNIGLVDLGTKNYDLAYSEHEKGVQYKNQFVEVDANLTEPYLYEDYEQDLNFSDEDECSSVDSLQSGRDRRLFEFGNLSHRCNSIEGRKPFRYFPKNSYEETNNRLTVKRKGTLPDRSPMSHRKKIE